MRDLSASVVAAHDTNSWTGYGGALCLGAICLEVQRHERRSSQQIGEGNELSPGLPGRELRRAIARCACARACSTVAFINWSDRGIRLTYLPARLFSAARRRLMSRSWRRFWTALIAMSWGSMGGKDRHGPTAAASLCQGLAVLGR